MWLNRRLDVPAFMTPVPSAGSFSERPMNMGQDRDGLVVVQELTFVLELECGPELTTDSPGRFRGPDSRSRPARAGNHQNRVSVSHTFIDSSKSSSFHVRKQLNTKCPSLDRVLVFLSLESCVLRRRQFCSRRNQIHNNSDLVLTHITCTPTAACNGNWKTQF
jgi:hypothetical protein